MKITVIIGTEVKGVTYNMKEHFLHTLRPGNEVTEFVLPRDMPYFCCGCKTCFTKSERHCPHASSVIPIWNAMIETDLLVFAAPVYVMRTPGQMKALLDHFGCHRMVHRLEAAMFTKRAVIITNSIGAPNTAAQKDIATSLTWLGVSHIRTFGVGLMEGVIWDELSDTRRENIKRRLTRLAGKCARPVTVRKNMQVRLFWSMTKAMHKGLLKKEEGISADNQHWIDNGWIAPPGDSI